MARGDQRPKARARDLKGLTKQPRALPVREGNEQHPSFSFEYADRNSTDEWHFSLDGDAAKTVMDFLCEMSRLSWKEIAAQQTGGRNRHRKHHEQEVESLCREAQKRFSDLGLDRIADSVYRFRLTGESRLWGFVKERTFYVLWWDPSHQVYPTEPS
jgi:hypothetical protein